MRRSDRRSAGPLRATLVIGAAWSISSSPATPGEINFAGDAAKPAAAGSFASKSEAEAFLARALPAATAANPKYRSPGSDVETRWLTRKISFKDNERGVVVVSTAESVEDYRADALNEPTQPRSPSTMLRSPRRPPTTSPKMARRRAASCSHASARLASRRSGARKNPRAPRLTYISKTTRSDGKFLTRSGRLRRSPPRPSGPRRPN